MQAGTRDLARRERARAGAVDASATTDVGAARSTARVFFGEFDKQFDDADEGGDLHVLATFAV